MRVHTAFLGVLALCATLGLVVAQDRPAREPALAPRVGVQTTAPREREPDVRALTDLLASFVKAYNEKDAKALGALFTPEAEIEDEDGEVTRGRDAIVSRFSEMFKESGGDSLAVETDSLRFLGTDLAIEEGTASLTTQTANLPTPTATASSMRGRTVAGSTPGSATNSPTRSPRTNNYGNWNGCSASGSTRATTGSSRPTASGRMKATSCSGSSTSRLRAASH